MERRGYASVGWLPSSWHQTMGLGEKEPPRTLGAFGVAQGPVAAQVVVCAGR